MDNVPRERRYDAEVFRAQFEGTEEIFTQIVRLFVTGAPARMSELEEALAAADRDGVARTAHALANSTGAVRAFHAVELCRGIERTARKAGLAGLEKRLAELRASVEEIVNALSQYS